MNFLCVLSEVCQRRVWSDVLADSLLLDIKNHCGKEAKGRMWLGWALWVIRYGLVLLFLVNPEELVVQECTAYTSSLSKGDVCWAWVRDLRPSQFAVGEHEVRSTMVRGISLSL